VLDGLALTDTCSVAVVRAVLLTSAKPVQSLEPEDLPPLPPIVNDDQDEPCLLCRSRTGG